MHKSFLSCFLKIIWISIEIQKSLPPDADLAKTAFHYAAPSKLALAVCSLPLVLRWRNVIMLPTSLSLLRQWMLRTLRSRRFLNARSAKGGGNTELLDHGSSGFAAMG